MPPRKRSAVTFQPRDLMEVTSREDMQRILECPTCKAVPLPPIFNCIMGHIICSNCRPKMQLCGICRSEYTDSRNFLAEEIVRTSKMACDFRDKGCKWAITGEDFQGHIEFCDFGPIRCIYGHKDGCNDADISISDYANHLSDWHQIEKLSPGDENFAVSYRLSDASKSSGCWSRVVFYDGQAFFVRSLLRNDVFHFVVLLIGSDVDAAKYRVRLRHKQPGNAEIKFESIVPVVSVRNSEEEVLEHIHCLLPKAIMMKNVCTIEELPGNKEALNWAVEYKILSI